MDGYRHGPLMNTFPPLTTESCNIGGGEDVYIMVMVIVFIILSCTLGDTYYHYC